MVSQLSKCRIFICEKGNEVENQYLKEENYQKTNGKIKLLSIIILIVGLLVGGGLIGFGLFKQNEAESQKQSALSATNARLSEIKQKIASLKSEAALKEEECDAISMSDDGWFEKSDQCDKEIFNIESEISDLETEQFTVENQHVEEPFTAPFYIFGAFIIIGSIMISFAIWFITKRRAVHAYVAQQTMPVNKEIIKEYSEPIADAAGKIANAVKESPKSDK